MFITSQPRTLALYRCESSHATTYLVTPLHRLHSKAETEDIERVNEELSSIQRNMELLYVKHIYHLRRLNSLQSITCIIPPEILSHIMEFATPIVKPVRRRDLDMSKTKLLKYAPLNFSAVSSHWRHVACATPLIWTSFQIELDFHVNKVVCEKKIELLRYYFERAKSLPLSLAFGNFYEPNARNYKRLLDVALRENPTRIKALYATQILVDWIGLDGQYIYHQIETLELSAPAFALTRSSYSLPVLPALQRLTLSCVKGVQLLTTTITHLHLSEMTYNDCFNLLLACQETLVEFHCQMQISHWDPYWLGSNPQIHTIPRLETIRWDMSYIESNSPWDMLLLHRLDLPSLRNVSLLGLGEDHVRAYKTLLQRTPSPLSRIHISTTGVAFAVPKDDLWRFLDMNSRNLSVNGCRGEICALLNALTPSYHFDTKLLFPGLRELSLAGDLPPMRVRVRSWTEVPEGGSSDDGSQCDSSNDVGLDHNLSDDDELNPGESYIPFEAGEIFCQALIQMLKERLLLAEEDPKTAKKPFALTLYFQYDHSNDYSEKLRPFIDAGLLKLVITNQDVRF